ncbi:MAG: histidine phosphatase family protein [Actinomycetota bacterium]|nr:histidine phosphatase family protein [Actinomycetota bacterium]
MTAAGGGAGLRARRVYLVRHGETELSTGGAYSGRQELPLTDDGREQARAVGERLRGAGIDVVYSSPLSRASDTARAIAEVTGAPLEIDDRLTEVDYGVLENYDRDSAREEFGEPFERWREDPFGSPFPGMEPLGEALARVRSAVSDALAAGECPAIVGHQGVLRLVLIALGQKRPEEYFDTRLKEAEPVEIESPSLVPGPGRGPPAGQPVKD